MIAIELSLVLFIMLYKVVLPLKSLDANYLMTIHMIAIELSLVLFIMLYKVVLPLKSLDEILKCDHLKEIY